MPSLKEILFGKEEQVQEFQKFNPQQIDILNQILGGAGKGIEPGIQNILNILGGGEEAFSAFEAPIKRQFQEQVIPGISEQFAGAGALNSSALGQQLGSASAQLSEGLSAQRAGLQQGALQQLQQLLGTGLTPQTDQVLRPGTQGVGGDIIGSLLKAFASGGFGK